MPKPKAQSKTSIRVIWLSPSNILGVEGWPACDHDEADKALYEAKIASRYYRSESGEEEVARAEALTVAKRAVNEKALVGEEAAAEEAEDVAAASEETAKEAAAAVEAAADPPPVKPAVDPQRLESAEHTAGKAADTATEARADATVAREQAATRQKSLED